MENYQQEERKLCIVDCVWNILFHWRWLFLCMLLFAILFGGVKYAKDYKSRQLSVDNSHENKEFTIENILEEIRQLPDEDRVDAESAIQLVKALCVKKNYAENAMIMKLDCYNMNRMVLQYYIKADNNTSELLQAYSNSYLDTSTIDRIVEASNGTISSDDVVDMISTRNGGAAFQVNNVNKDAISLGNENAIMYVTIRGDSKENIKKIADIIKVIFEEYYKQAELIYGKHSLVLVGESYLSGRDEEAVNVQEAVYESIYSMNDKLETLKGRMSEEASGMLDEYENALSTEMSKDIVISDEKNNENAGNVSVSLKWVLLGIIIGIIFMGGLEVVFWLMGGKLNSPEELQQNFNIRIYGVIEERKSHKILGNIDKYIYKLKNRNKKVLNSKQEFDMILSGIVLGAKQRGIAQIYLTGTELDRTNVQEFLNNLQRKADKLGVGLVIGQSISCNSDSLSDMTKIGNVIVVEEIKVSKYYEIVRELQMCEEQNVNVLGSIVFNH